MSPIAVGTTAPSPDAPSPAVPAVRLDRAAVFPRTKEPNEPDFVKFDDWPHPITYFVGRNGTGKSRTAAAVCRQLSGHLLATDRLLGLMKSSDYGFGSAPSPESYRGVPLSERDEQNINSMATPQREGFGIASATQNLMALRTQPEVWLKVAAFIQRALGRVVDLRETSGYLDPFVRVGRTEYSLFREEGHGLREIVILLAAAYRSDWKMLVVDEPELHLHPSMARMWIGELDQECRKSNRRAIVVTHEPSLIRPKSADDLRAVWHFAPGARPARIADHIMPIQADRVTASLQLNPDLVSQLVFSPRPVLVEGPHDVAALTASLQRTEPPEVVAQTDLVPCGGSGGLALWYEIATKMGLDIKAVGDLDACFASEVQRALDNSLYITQRYIDDLAAEPAKTGAIVKNLIVEMDKAGVAADPKSRAQWLAGDNGSPGFKSRKSKLIEIWRSANLWLHPQGTLENVLGTSVKGVPESQVAAQTPGPIDEVASWCAYSLDPRGDVFELLSAAIERIAHNIMQALRLSPETEFSEPVGSTAKSDSRLATVSPLGKGLHRLTVLAPQEFAGYWLDFSRDTPSSKLALQSPSEHT